MNISIIDDQTLENDETFTVQLSSPDTDVILELQDATVSISDNDGKEIYDCMLFFFFFMLRELRLPSFYFHFTTDIYRNRNSRIFTSHI